MSISRHDFGPRFHWGVSTAAYQIEGAYQTDGKGLSIWDVFTNTKGKTKNNETGNTACDFYHRYAQDLVLMRSLNIQNNRFSLSWSRLLPHGTGKVNKAGLDFYNRVIDFCLELGIKPWVTLYHWDLPYELERKGGWTNRDIIGWFSDYVECCVKHFGDRVTNWMVLNEPMVFTGAGHFLGIHAPGRRGMSHFLPAVHHAAMCQAEGARIIKSIGLHFNVGTTFSCSLVQPHTGNPSDIAAAERVDALLNRLFIEPLLGLGYPTQELSVLNDIYKYIKPGDEERLKHSMDFVGIQNYTREIVRHSYFIPYINAQLVKASRRKVETTVMNWEVYPECIYEMLKYFGNYKNIPRIIVTENGAAFPDTVLDGVVNDARRVRYLRQHIQQVLKARQEGIPVDGYFIWTFMDNFEWAEGYHPRFGLVYVDHPTQKRTVKASGKWYRNFLDALPEMVLNEKGEEV